MDILNDKLENILRTLRYEPFVCPTARDSIQIEYEKDNGDYLEFEIFRDRVEMYSETKKYGVLEYCIMDDSMINDIVIDFWEE